MFFFTFLEKKGNFGVFQEFFRDFDDCTDFVREDIVQYISDLMCLEAPSCW